MKKSSVLLILFLLIQTPVVFAQMPDTNQNINRPQMQDQLRIHTPEDLEIAIQQRQHEFENETINMRNSQKIAYTNQNEVRLAVHAMIMMENMTNGIGRNISQIATQYNNSIQSTLNAEEQIQSRGSITRFFFGGDASAATTLNTTAIQNREHINEMTQLMLDCTNCTEEVKAIMQEQIRTMQEEQARLEILAENELRRKGIFGWLYK